MPQGAACDRYTRTDAGTGREVPLSDGAWPYSGETLELERPPAKLSKEELRWLIGVA